MPSDISSIVIDGSKFTYKLKSTKLNKRVKISIRNDGIVVVTKPTWTPAYIVDNFLKQNAEWLKKNLSKYYSPNITVAGRSRLEFIKHRADALKLVKAKISEINSFYGFKVGNITIRDQVSRWGSCSKKGSLNFNYRIVHLSEELVDYLVVHELCHLKEMNHSKNFWALVEKYIPNYKEIKAELHKIKF